MTNLSCICNHEGYCHFADGQGYIVCRAAGTNCQCRYTIHKDAAPLNVTVKRFNLAHEGSTYWMDEDPEGAYVTWEAYASLLQAITDPENQPSQFGTRLSVEPTGDTK